MPQGSQVERPSRLLDPGMCLTLRPMQYPQFYEAYLVALKNNWTVDEVQFATDITDLRTRLTPAERHLIQRLVAFFATGDSIVSNNLVLNLYRHLNAPEARMYLSRQLFEEALHVQFYLTLLDTYIPDPDERYAAFAAVETIPSIQKKADFCFKWIDSIRHLDHLETKEDRKAFLLNLVCFAACIEGLFFFAAFAYVYFFRSRDKGLLAGLGAGTDWVFRNESDHMAFAFAAVEVIRKEEPDLFDADFEVRVKQMLAEAVQCEYQFAEDLLQGGVVGLPLDDMRGYLMYVADQRLAQLGCTPNNPQVKRNPFTFMALQDVMSRTNFFEDTVSTYQVGVTGDVVLDGDF